jgi:hypothetical protein
LARVANADLLPYDFKGVTRELREALQQYLSVAGSSLSLAEPLGQLDELDSELDGFYSGVPNAKEATSAKDVNRLLIELARILVPMNYALGECFDHDPAEPLGVIPKLDRIVQLPHLEKDSDTWRFLVAELVRQRNKVSNALYQATQCVKLARRLCLESTQ